MNKQDLSYLNTVKSAFAVYKSGVKRKANGKLTYDYLVPSGVYEEQWDWDAFFMGIALSHEIPSEAIYLKNWVLNFLNNSDKNGFTPGCITPEGRDKRLHQMKPFLAQGAYVASVKMNDFSWLEKNVNQLEKIVLFREKNLWNSKYDLGVWFNSMESGADDNLAALNFEDKSIIGTDLNSFIYKEYESLSKIYKNLKKPNSAKIFEDRANEIKNNINKFLWSDELNSYLNLDISSNNHVKRISYNSIHPLWAGIASQKRAENFVNKYLLNKNKLWSNYGIRTLSKDDPGYNNENKIKPHSNWQGPIWVISNYFYTQALIRYGFQKKSVEVVKKIAEICIDDIKKSGGMHENYDAENGKPLAAPNFISWNLLLPEMLESSLSNKLIY